MSSSSSASTINSPPPSQFPAIPLLSAFLSIASILAISFGHFGTKESSRNLFKLAFAACICVQIGTEIVLLSANQYGFLLSHAPLLELALSVFSELALLFWPLLLLSFLLSLHLVKNRVFTIGLLCFFGWTVSAIIGLAALQNCYYCLLLRPMPIFVHYCTNPDDRMLEQLLNAFPLAIFLLCLFILLIRLFAHFCCRRQESSEICPRMGENHAGSVSNSALIFVLFAEIFFPIRLAAQPKSPQRNRKKTTNSMAIFVPLAILDVALRIFHQKIGLWLWGEGETKFAGGWTRNHLLDGFPANGQIDPKLVTTLCHSLHFLILGLGFSFCMIFGDPKIRGFLRAKFRKVQIIRSNRITTNEMPFLNESFNNLGHR